MESKNTMNSAMNLKEFIRLHSFATLITQQGKTRVSHLNFVMGEENELCLYGHLASSNPQTADFRNKPKAIAVFSRDDIHQNDDEFAHFVHGNIEVVDDHQKKKRILDKLVQKYEIKAKARWAINWHDSRYEQQMKAITFIKMNITSTDIQAHSELDNTKETAEKSTSFPTWANVPCAESPAEQDTVYIPKHFYEGRAECLLSFIKEDPTPLTIVSNGDKTVARYVNLNQPESMARLLATAGLDSSKNKALMIFSGPHCYISPRFYRSSNNVPTWNYMKAYVEGTVIGSEFEPHRIFGKFKLSQNRTAEDRRGVYENLSTSTEKADRAVASCIYIVPR